MFRLDFLLAKEAERMISERKEMAEDAILGPETEWRPLRVVFYNSSIAFEDGPLRKACEHEM
ncbi:hypothetical protein COL516b_006763 [Colletotrichum fioriniae]|nr:uncharacterized protein COL516b_006763 [Colletotrichum fioriniae]KAJ0303248.1 hypothetical protein COL516b_006763 [Colletotrichum fioriniae]